ncbi:hypothetical protein JN01_0345 [Entomoplasma freundtii]|uniref:Metallophosphoesterase n=1 Tax=Entomoplasma freundtii TaxID=74700 RepID=A0A2K8NUE3_9MOLU|nr:TIGR00282 family metallophosphoesterase [Entomoplasma freundtii]ATZ16243.1 metallophosphoesterase [Entomoplasma freundtii]TDY56856.1 hypothetical protein JN01_0345 [Entomoplasma freundtii]
MKILMIGDIFGEVGRKAIKKNLPQLIQKQKIDFVVANGENATHGKSIIEKHFQELKALGVDVVTSGNHIFKQKSVLEYIQNEPTLLRPLNMTSYLPGHGFCVVEKKHKRVGVLNLMGTSFMDHVNNPYEAMDQFLKQKKAYDILLIDFHAEASAEKMAFAWNYDGQVTAFVGTHTHVQTADSRLLPKGTAYITDLGMTGPYNSIIGANPEQVIHKEKTGLPSRFEPASGPAQFCGVIIEVDEKTNQATKIENLFLHL